MGTYRLKARARRGSLARARALAWAVACYTGLRGVAWLLDARPHAPAWAVEAGHLVYTACLLACLFNLLRVVGGDLGDGEYRDTFEVTITPNGVRRVSIRGAEKDVFFPREEIVGFYDGKTYLVRILTKDPLRHLTITRALDRFDDFKQELIAIGIEPIVQPTNWRVVAPLTVMVGVVGAAPYFLPDLAPTVPRLAVISMFLLSVVAAIAWFLRRNPDVVFVPYLWLLAAGSIWDGLDQVMKRQHHGMSDSLFFSGLLLCIALPWCAPASLRWIRRASSRRTT